MSRQKPKHNLRSRVHATALSSAILTLLFASLWTLVSKCELLSPAWRVTAGEPAPVTVRLPSHYFRITMLRNEFHYLSTVSSACPRMVQRGTQLRPRSECSELVKAFESARRPLSDKQLLGTFVFCFVICLLLTIFMSRREMGRARLLRAQIAVFLLLTVVLLVCKALLLFTALPAFVLPIVLVPLLTAYFFNKQLSLFAAVITSLLAASLLNFDFELFLVFLISGLAAIASLGKRHRAYVHLKAGAIAAWVAVMATAVSTLVFAGTLNIHDDLTEHIDPRYSLWISALIGGLASGLFAWLLTPVTGQLVGEVSRGRLQDLQELDQRLIKLLRERAPGTWEHSRAIANLAEAAAHAIGANALLVRVGAYYHDVGKSVRPDLFIENQGGGPNPHDELDPEQSAQRIFSHVVEGTRVLRAEGIPEDVVEFSYSHHGKSVLEFFWEKNQAAGNPGNLTVRDFQYPGHRPWTRETGILMIVDAIEAAARTVENPDKSAFQALVQRIIFYKLSQGQLDETGLSLSDLRIIANTLTDTLANMYHTRIKYPWQTGDTGSLRATGDSSAAEGTNGEAATETTGPQERLSEPAATEHLNDTGSLAAVTGDSVETPNGARVSTAPVDAPKDPTPARGSTVPADSAPRNPTPAPGIISTAPADPALVEPPSGSASVAPAPPTTASGEGSPAERAPTTGEQAVVDVATKQVPIRPEPEPPAKIVTPIPQPIAPPDPEIVPADQSGVRPIVTVEEQPTIPAPAPVKAPGPAIPAPAQAVPMANVVSAPKTKDTSDQTERPTPEKHISTKNNKGKKIG